MAPFLAQIVNDGADAERDEADDSENDDRGYENKESLDAHFGFGFPFLVPFFVPCPCFDIAFSKKDGPR